MLPTAALAAPTTLNVIQLDLITAGVSATVAAGAQAQGRVTFTNTTAKTKASGNKHYSVALGRGKAVAKGTDAAASNVAVSGEGTIVHTTSKTVSRAGPEGAVSKSWGVVGAVEINFDR
jgi:hypothetical protein